MATWQQTYQKLKKKKDLIDNNVIEPTRTTSTTTTSSASQLIAPSVNTSSNTNSVSRQILTGGSNLITNNENYKVQTPYEETQELLSTKNSTQTNKNTQEKTNKKDSTKNESTKIDTKSIENQYKGYTKEQLQKEYKSLQDQIFKYSSNGVKQIKNEDGSYSLSGLWNTFTGKNAKKQKNDTEYQTLLKKQEIVNKLMYDELVETKEYDNGFTGFVDKENDVVFGGITKGVRGLEGTVKKVLGQEDTISEKTTAEKLGEHALQNANNKYEKFALEMGSSFGQMVPQILAPGGKAATVVGFANYGGSAYNQAKEEGYTEDQATKYGVAVGSLETMLNKILPSFSINGKNIYGKTATDKVTGKIMSKVAGNEVLKRTLTQGAGEFTEEYLQEFLEPIVRETFLEEDNEVGIKDAKSVKELAKNVASYTAKNFFTKENAYAGLQGFVMSGTMGLQSNIDTAKAIKQDTATAIEQKSAELGRDLTTEEQNAIKQEVSNQYAQMEEDSEKTISPLIEKGKNAIQNVFTKENATNDNQTNNTVTQENNSNSPVEADSNIQNIENNTDTEAKRRNFTYDNTQVDNEYSKSVYESASKVMNDTETSHKFADVVSKIATEKNTNYEFTNNEDLKTRGYNLDGKEVNGLVTTDENGNNKVLINIDSAKALNTILGHETTHLLEGTTEYQALQDTIFEYAKTNGEYDSRYNKLSELYKDVKNANIENELTSDLVGDYLFTDSKFIENLSVEKPTVFQKIRELIDDLVVKFKGTAQEKQLREVQKKFKEAYRKNNTQKQSDTKYSIHEREDGSKYIKVDTDQHIFENVEPKDYKKTVKKYMNDYLRGEAELGNINSDEKVNIGTKGINKYTNPGSRQVNFNEKMKAAPELQNILEVSEKIGESDASKKNSKYSKWEYYKFDFSIDGKDYSGRVNIGVDSEGGKHFYEINNIQQKNTGGIYPLRDNLHTGASGNNIPQNGGNVKYSLSERLSGDALLDAQDFIEEVKSVGANVDEKGYVTVYHQTSTENANKIKETGKMSGKEYGIFFSTSKNAQQSEGRGQTKLEFKIPAEKLVLDDIFSDNADVKIESKPGQSIDVSDYIVNDTNSNTKYSLKMDNQGRTLTKEQQEYFKDSKIKTPNGELRVMYHGTNADFTVFDRSKANPNGGHGSGFYFTTAKDHAMAYNSKNVGEYYLNITNPLSLSTQTINEVKNGTYQKQITKDNLTKLVNEMYNNEDFSMENYGYGKTAQNIVDEIYSSKDTDYDMLSDLNYTAVGDMTKFVEYVNDTIGTSFDGIVTDYETLAFNSNQIKSVDNTNPTTNEDIRKSLGSEQTKTGDYNVYGEDVKVEAEKTIAPIKQELESLRKELQSMTKSAKKEVKTLSKEINKIVDSAKEVKGTTEQQIAPLEETTKTAGNIAPSVETEIKQANDTTENIDKVAENWNNFEQNEDGKYTIKRDPIQEYVDNQLTKKVDNKSKTTIKKTKHKSPDFRYLFTNKNAAIDDFSVETGNKNIKFYGDQVNNVHGEISTNINKAQTDNNGNSIGKGIEPIFNQAKQSGLNEAFNDYLFHLSNEARHKQGKGSQVPANESARLILEYENSYPEMKQWANEVNQYNRNNLQKQVDAGLITNDLANKLTSMYDFYVPFMEDIENNYVNQETYEIKPKQTIKYAKGGANKNLLSFEDAMIKQTESTIRAIRKNQLYNEIVKSSKEKASIGADVRENINDISDSLYADNTGYYLTSYQNGERQSAQISEDLYKSLNNELENKIKSFEAKHPKVFKPLQTASNIRRNILTTWSPTFVLTNPMKDIQDAPLNSKYAKDWAKNYPKAMKEIVTGKGEHLSEFMNLYGEAGLLGDYSTDSGLSDTSKIVEKSNRQTLAKKFLTPTGLNEMVELAPRYAEYLASKEHGASNMEAIYNAREVTTNFGRGGVITKALNRNGFTFLNASVQGFSKLGRNFTENGMKGAVQTSIKAASLGIVPALANALMYGLGDDEDEDYKVLPDYIKDNYYVFKTSDGSFLRIPKGRMMSIFGSAARRTLEYAQGEKDAFDGYLKNAYSQVGIQNPSESNILAPIIQAKNNKTWYGTDLVPSRLQDLPEEEQTDASIDSISNWIGQKLGISPYKVNYIIDQYSGGIGDMILPTLTTEAQSDSDSVVGTMLAPLKDKFTADSTNDNKNVSDFYTKNDELNVKSNSKNATEEDKLLSKYMKSVSYEMGALYKEQRAVQENKDLSKSEKYKKAQAIKQQINELAKEGLEGYKNVSKTDNYAEVGGREFYKYIDDETGETVWASVKDEDSEELNSLGLDINEKSEYYTVKSDIRSIRNQYSDSSDYDVKKKEIINSIINSNLPDEAKYSLYDSSYGNSEDVKAVRMLDLDADTFLEYASQTFKADKDENGKSISGSKKDKVFNYINSMNIGFEEKVILAKLEYNTYNEWNNEIIDYLNNSPMSYEEMEFVLKQMGFEVDSEGNIKW